MPSKSSTKKTPKKSRKGVFSVLKSFASGKGKSLLAVLVVLGVMGLGYYGYVRSNADSLSNTPPTVKCGAKLTEKECKQKQAASDAAFYEQLSKDCAAANRIYADKSCGGCQRGFYDNNGTCKERQKVDCTTQGRVQVTDYTCGDCTSGVETNGVCQAIPTNPDAARAACTALHRGYSETDKKCTDCVSGYSEIGGMCIKDRSAPPNNELLSQQKECKDLHRQWVSATNTCGSCLSAYATVNDTCVSVNQARATCIGQYRTYNEAAKKCGGCLGGYEETNGECKKKLTPQEECALSGSGTCLNSDAVKKICEYTHRKYDSKKNVCKDECVTDRYYLNGSICLPISGTPAAQVKASCDKINLQYDSETNRCLDKCKVTYVKRDGKCVEWTEASMSQFRCDALGRIWTPASADVSAFCATKCSYSEALYVDTGNDNTSYCVVRGTSSAGAGVSVNMTREQCTAAHRVWIGPLEACSSRCATGYFLNNGDCTKVKPAGNATSTSGDGGTGGCSQPLQHLAVRGTDNSPQTGTICPDDEPNTPPAATDANVPVTHDVAVLMSHATCNALGRVWVPDANTVNGKKKGGCSTQECKVQTAEVRRANGSAYCEGSVDRISEKDCKKAHRDWLDEVNGCAAVPVKKGNNKTIINAKACTPPYTVYVQHPAQLGGDECVKPTPYQRLQAIAQNTGRPVVYLASLGPKALCALQDNKQWIDGKCVKTRVPSDNNNPAGGGAGNSDNSNPDTSLPQTIHDTAWCRDNLRRQSDGTHCTSQCYYTGEVLTADSRVCHRTTIR